jgi:cell division septal protein FtsQ
MSGRVSSLRSKQQKTKRRKTRLYKYVGLLTLFALVFGGLIFLFRADFLKIKNVSVSGNTLVPESVIKEIAWQKMNNAHFFVLPKNNIVIYPKRNIEKEILEKFRTVMDVKINRGSGGVINIQITEYKPKYLWCNGLSREKCYFMSENGFIFSESADFTDDVLFTFYGLVEADDPIGKTYTSNEKFVELNYFVESMKLLDISPVGLSARGQGDFELRLLSGGQILFSDREDFLNTFENLETIISEQTRLDKDFLKKLEYIDIRFSSKVFVKMKN